MTPLAWCARSCYHRSLVVNNNSFITTTPLSLGMVLLNLVTCMRCNAIYFLHSSVSICVVFFFFNFVDHVEVELDALVVF